MKLHELMTRKAMLAGSPNTPDVVQQSKELPVVDTDGDATQGFGTIDGWN